MINLLKHLKIDMRKISDHPIAEMKMAGITYQYAVPQSMLDTWYFFNCQNVPNPLPEFLMVLDVSPMALIGSGLSKEMAMDIVNFRVRELFLGTH